MHPSPPAQKLNPTRLDPLRGRRIWWGLGGPGLAWAWGPAITVYVPALASPACSGAPPKRKGGEKEDMKGKEKERR